MHLHFHLLIARRTTELQEYSKSTSTELSKACSSHCAMEMHLANNDCHQLPLTAKRLWTCNLPPDHLPSSAPSKVVKVVPESISLRRTVDVTHRSRTSSVSCMRIRVLPRRMCFRRTTPRSFILTLAIAPPHSGIVQVQQPSWPSRPAEGSWPDRPLSNNSILLDYPAPRYPRTSSAGAGSRSTFT